MNALQRAARAALQCCCRSLHSRAITSVASSDGEEAALSVLRVSSKIFRNAFAVAGPSVPGAFGGGALGGGVFRGVSPSWSQHVPSSGQAAAMLQMSQVNEALSQGGQPVQLSALDMPGGAEAEPMYATSVRRKRKTKMNKHKHRKRLKKMRHGSK